MDSFPKSIFSRTDQKHVSLFFFDSVCWSAHNGCLEGVTQELEGRGGSRASRSSPRSGSSGMCNSSPRGPDTRYTHIHTGKTPIHVKINTTLEKETREKIRYPWYSLPYGISEKRTFWPGLWCSRTPIWHQTESVGIVFRNKCWAEELILSPSTHSVIYNYFIWCYIIYLTFVAVLFEIGHCRVCSPG